ALGVRVGIVRPVQINRSDFGDGELDRFNPNLPRFWGYLRGKRTDRWSDSNVHCCSLTANGMFRGHFTSSDWATRAPPDRINGFQPDIPIGLLLDLDEGTLTLYQNGQRLTTPKDGLSGEYCWYSSAYDCSLVNDCASVSVERGLAPGD
ncbi:hypothetical protein THAOC_29287, partial [Thalassiosira oceanica]